MPFIELGSDRQQKLYEHTMSVYRKVRGDEGDWIYTLHLENKRCYFFSTSNADTPMDVGLIKKDLAIAQDKVHFDASLDIQGQDIILETTTGHPNKGTWYKIVGEPQVRAATSRRNTNVGKAFINKTTKPALDTD